MSELLAFKMPDQASRRMLPPGDDQIVAGPMTDEPPTAIAPVGHPGPPRDAAHPPDEAGPGLAPPGGAAATEVCPDFPEVAALSKRHEFTWDEDKPPVDNMAALGEALNGAGDLYRSSIYGGGLVLGSVHPHVPPTPIDKPGRLNSIILDRLVVKVLKDGKSRGGNIPTVHLRAMLQCEAFLQEFSAVDEITERPMYLPPDFRLTVPGYNDGGFGRRILHTGRAASIGAGLDHINRFLDVMDFESGADRANALGAALIVLLRNMWPGGKPIIIVTSTKSHGGKETIITFVALGASMVAISYQETDWALERQLVAALKQDARTGLINVDNARLGKHREIRSAFLERFLTDPEPFLHSTGTGRPVRRRNDIVLTMSSNFGTMSGDLMNRALPIRLTPRGDVLSRRSPIGNPKMEYLPAHREQITAELRGMIEAWKAAGGPLDESKHHPFTECIRTIAGILMVNGEAGFLDNLHARRTVDDPVRHALGLLGTASLDGPSDGNPEPAGFHEPRFWADAAVRLGLARALIPAAERDTDGGRARATGVVLSAHQGETFELETSDDRLLLRLVKARRRFVAGDEPSTRYRFEVVARTPVPADDEAEG